MPTIGSGRIQSGTGEVLLSSNGPAAASSSVSTFLTTFAVQSPATGLQLWSGVTQTAGNVILTLRNVSAGAGILLNLNNGIISIAVDGTVEGPTGPAGPSVTGPTGPAGPSVTGPTGPAGADSTVTGPTGPAGASITGPTGPSVTGPTGPASTVTGPTGPAGPSVTGPTGPPGPTGAAGPGSLNRTLVFGFTGQPTSSQLLQIPITDAGTLLANAAGAQGNCATNPSSTWTFILASKDEGFIGTIDIDTSGVFSWPSFSAIAMAAGDVLFIEAPFGQDPTGSDVVFSMKFLLS
jgi:hypothetical protein